jgi:hypothetical protein
VALAKPATMRLASIGLILPTLKAKRLHLITVKYCTITGNGKHREELFGLLKEEIIKALL